MSNTLVDFSKAFSNAVIDIFEDKRYSSAQDFALR